MKALAVFCGGVGATAAVVILAGALCQRMGLSSDARFVVFALVSGLGCIVTLAKINFMAKEAWLGYVWGKHENDGRRRSCQ
jgi:hypothetical protein